MELNFKMTAEDYYLGLCLKREKNNIKNDIDFSPYILLAVFFIISAVYFKSLLYIGMDIVFAVVFVIFQKRNMKKSFIKQYETSAVLKSRHTLRTYSEGLEIINSYEKVFVPWQGLFHVENNEKYLLILPTYQKGIIAVNKSKYGGNELDAMIEFIRSNAPSFKEGK